jgi:RNA polymerase sigma-70 factor (ECF subfamily)
MPVVYQLMLEQLIKGCREGDRLSQRRLYELFYGKMMGICLRYASHREDAADILNQGFLKVFDKIITYDASLGQLEGWIRRIIINTAIDHYRKEIRRGYTVDIDQAKSVQSDIEITGALEVASLLELVQQLPPAYRTVFNLFAIEGYSHPEIASQLGISEGTSKSNLAKARKKLQQAVAALNQGKETGYGG